MYALLIIGVVTFILSLVMENHDPILYISYIFFVITGIVALVGSVVGLLAKPSSIKGTLIGLGGMILIFVISYALADGSDYEMYAEGITESTSKLSEMLLISLYILGSGAVLSLAASWVIKITR